MQEITTQTVHAINCRTRRMLQGEMLRLKKKADRMAWGSTERAQVLLEMDAIQVQLKRTYS